MRTYKPISDDERQLLSRQLKLNQLVKLEKLKQKKDQVVDNVVLVKNGIVHPSSLKTTEITRMELNFYKLKKIHSGLLRRDEETIVIAMKVPHLYKFIDCQMKNITR